MVIHLENSRSHNLGLVTHYKQNIQHPAVSLCTSSERAHFLGILSSGSREIFIKVDAENKIY